MLANGTVFSVWSHVPCFSCLIWQTSAPARLSSGLQPWAAESAQLQAHSRTVLTYTGTAKALLNRSCYGKLSAVRWTVLITDPSPPCGLAAGSAQAGSCSGPTSVQQVLSLFPAKTWAGVGLRPYSRRRADPLSLCIVWFSSGSLRVPGRCPIMLLLLPFLPGATGDSHSLPVQDLFGLLGLVQMLAGCYFGAGIRNSANTSLKKEEYHTAFTEHSVKKTRILKMKPQLWGIWDIWQTCTRFFMIVLKDCIWLATRCLKLFANVILTLFRLIANDFED